MPTPTESEASIRAPTPAGPVRWEYRPWQEGIGDVLTLLLSAAVSYLIVVYETTRPLLAWFVSGMILTAGWRILVPAEYEISAVGVKVQIWWRRKRVSWRDIERIEIGRAGLFLIPPGSPWGWWRGLYLPWLRQRNEVLSALRHFAQRRFSMERASSSRTLSAAEALSVDEN